MRKREGVAAKKYVRKNRVRNRLMNACASLSNFWGKFQWYFASHVKMERE